MAYDLALAERIRKAVGGRPGVTEKEMFGGVCFLLDGLMFVGVMKPGFGTIEKGGMMVRVGAEADAAALDEPHAIPFEMRGRRMAGYVIVEPDGVTTPAAVKTWTERAWKHVSTLEKKKKKPAAKKSATRKR
jgi:hypothetical protein